MFFLRILLFIILLSGIVIEKLPEQVNGSAAMPTSRKEIVQVTMARLVHTVKHNLPVV